jgi:hypothetical protein
MTGYAANEYMLHARWRSVTGSEAAQMLENGDTFVLDCYRASCGNSKYVGAKVLMDWMDTYGKDVYGVDVDASDGVPAFVWTALGKTSATLPFVAFVRDGKVTAYSPEGDLTAFAQTVNDAFFAFYTDVTRVSLTVVTPPDKTVYLTGEPLDTTGMTLLAVHADGSSETVREGFTCTGFTSDTPGHRTVTVSYNGMETTFTAAVNTPDGKPSVWVVQPAKTKLKYGDTAALSADYCNLPEDACVEWSYSFRTIRGTQTQSASGTSVRLTAQGFTQTVTVTAAAVAADGSPIRTADGEAVTATHEIRFQNNIFIRIRVFFENLFNRSGCGSEI